MTSVIAWIAANERRASGLYFASDSRRSFSNSNHPTDDCVKLFAPKETREIFAFAGDVTFPSGVLQHICSLLEQQPGLYASLDGAYARMGWVYGKIQQAFNALPSLPAHGFSILHGTRDGFHSGATFSLFRYMYDVAVGRLESEVIPCAVGQSVHLSILGTGRPEVQKMVDLTAAKQGDVSKSNFAAFCSAVTYGNDKFSGGPIQLVGVLSIKDALHFGVITPKGRFYRGKTAMPGSLAGVHWRNSAFDVVDENGVLL